MSNYIGMLKEKLDRFQGLSTPPKYETVHQGVGFECLVSFTLTRIDMTSRLFSANSIGNHTSKKSAEQSAACLMLSTASFVNFYHGRIDAPLDENAVPPSSADQNPENDLPSAPIAMSLTGALVIPSVSSQQVIVTSAGVNHKGLLLERIAKHAPHYVAAFQSSGVAPFVSTVTVKLLVGGPQAGEFSVSGAYAPTKKQAEQNAASVMLADPRFQALCGSSPAVSPQPAQPVPDDSSVVSNVSTATSATAGHNISSFSTSSLKTFNFSVNQTVGTMPILHMTNNDNVKGLLLEKVAQMKPQRRAEFSTTESAPFVSTVRIMPGNISATGSACSTKKRAEWQAAYTMLQHELFQGPASSLPQPPPLLNINSLGGSTAAAVPLSETLPAPASPVIAPTSEPTGALASFSLAPASMPTALETGLSLPPPGPGLTGIAIGAFTPPSAAGNLQCAGQVAPPSPAAAAGRDISRPQDLSRSTSFSSQPYTASSGALAANYKGQLQEKLTTMPSRPNPVYDTTRIAPFVCTLTLKLAVPAAGASPSESEPAEAVFVRSDGFPTKKAAEQQAAERMLNHELFQGPTSPSPPLLMASSSPGGSTAAVVPLSVTPALSASPAVASTATPTDAPHVPAAPSSTPGVLVTMTAAETGLTLPPPEPALGFTTPLIPSTATGILQSAGSPAAVIKPDISRPQDLSRSTSFSSQPSTASSGALAANYKGQLQEKLTTMLSRPNPAYDTTRIAPFVCTLTLQFPVPPAGASPSQSEPAAAAVFVRSDGFPTKKAAEQQAAERMLQHEFFSRDPDRSADCLADQTVRCVRCSGQIGTIADFMFYDKTDTEVQFALKPEVCFLLVASQCTSACADTGEPDQMSGTKRAPPRVRILPSEPDPSEPAIKAKCKVVCGLCKYNLGVQMATGPDSTTLTSFGNNKLAVKGRAFSSSQAWQTISVDPAFDDIEHRTEETFFGANSPSSRSTRQSFNHLPVVFPKLENGSFMDSADFQFTDLLNKTCKKEIKTEQLQAFHKALQQNMVIVFPTGFGKTFVASLIMHRFRILNPRKLVVMVVDRIPLVDQQSKAIHHDTDLLVCPLSSENSTRYIVGELLNGKYDALVVTAGSLHNYLDEGALRVSDFSLFVFDECHHVVGDHMYTRILQLIAQCPTRLRPRVVGLTASPFSAKSNDSAEIKLQKMLLALCEADIYCPKILNVTTQEIVRHPVSLTHEQHELQESLTLELKPLVQKLCEHFKANGMLETMIGPKPFRIRTPCDRFDWIRATNISAEAHFDSAGDGSAIKAVAAKTREVLRALKDNYLLGPHFVRRHTTPASAPSPASSSVHDGSTDDSTEIAATAVLSAQMQMLCSILGECGDKACILVFVDERHTAKEVLGFLSERFPHLGCQKLIGQGGFDGMRWRGNAGQGAILQAFRSGSAKLIVCTSVLEEGLDVKVCDRVIRLGGSPTLIQVIQSKGRARDKAGRLDLICTAEEEEHFDDLLDEEDLLDLVLRNRASGHSGNETPDYIAEFMQSCGVRGKPRHDIGDDDGDDESVASDDSASSAQPTEKSADLGEEEKPDAEELDNVDSKQRNYGVQLLLCSDHTDTEEMLTNALRLQAALVDYITKLHFSPRAASSVVSDPRMFRSSDSLALVGVSSAIDNFLSTFCSVWDFKVNSAPVYILAHPSRPSKPEKEKEPATPLLIESPSDINQEAFSERVETGPISSLGGVLGVSCGHLVSRQSFLQMGKLGRADLLEYKNIHVERGKRNTLLLEGCVPSNSDARVLVSIPATILSKSAVVSAERTEKTLTVFFALLSTPSVHFLPSVAGKKNSNSNIIGAKINLFDSLRSDCRVFCNATPPSDSSSVHNIASADLLQLASCPVIAVTFKLRKWRKVMKLFTNPSVLGLSVLVTRVAFGSYTGDLSHQSLLLEDTHVADELAVHQQLSKECQWTYATLVSDVYCPVLNPVVLVKIRAIVAAALLSKDEVRIRSVTTAMQQLQSHLKQCCYWEDALAYFTTALNTLETAAMRRESLSTVSGGDGDPSLSAVVGGSEQFPIESSEEYVMMPRVLATPSRLVVTPAVLTKTNRLIRLYGSKYRLVYVKFRDEQGQGLFSEKIFEGRYKQMLIQGFNICGRQYHFLLSSASQLREQTAVFFDGSLEDVFMIRNFIIPNKSVFNDDVAKYISRLGLFCTADSDTHVMLSKKNYLMEDDIYTKDGKILTDGAGRISTRLLREIFKDSGHHPSCIQIRALGCKGILVEDPDLETTHPGIDVVFRRSMCKFDTESHTSLCVVKTAEFNPVTLNREVINLLCAIRDKGEVKKWSPHSTMVALQDEELNRLGQMLVDPMCAIDSLSEHFPRKILWNMLQSELNILSEPHFMSLLHLQYYHASKALRRKSHIPILHGALIMGAPDPTGLLRDGEISIVIHRPVHRYADCFNDKDEYKVGEVTLKRVSPKSPEDANWAVGYETFVVTGPVAFYRNPCLDPGDLRVVTAVYRPELVHWKNVVLLPASAEYCKRSLSAECSGGDVDGDQFGIIWDSRLVPPRELGFDAVDYEQLAREAKQQQLRDTKAEPVSSDSSTAEKGSVDIELIRIADFVARTMCNCNLGRIANLHLALCDQVRKGAGNPLARELAKAQSLAVDYPKTGIPPVIPSEAKQVVRYTGYPHYMENDRKPSYPSFQSLGTLYNITSSVACTVAFAGADREFHADASFALPGWEECRAEAQESYELFERAARDLMLRYGLESDAELVLGVPYKWSDEFELDHASAAESLSAAWAALRGRFRRLFYSDLPDNSPAARLRKACAWYQVSYSQKSRLHSFAWIMVEELAQVKVTSAEAVTTLETHQLSGGGSWPVHDAVSITVGQGALRRWEQQRAQLVQALSIKDQQFARVKSAFLNSQAVQKYQTEFPGQKITVHLYGSAALLMCDYLSDIDICVNVPKLPAEMVLKDLVKPGVSAVAEWTSSVIPAKIPLVKLLVEDGHMSAPVEVTAQNSDGVHKSGLIRYLYSTNPTYLLLFSSIVQWARCCGLLRGFATEKRNALLNSGQVQALIVHFILERIPSLALPESALEKAHTDVTNTSILSAVSSADAYTLELGQLLLAFFMNYSQWGGAEDNEDTTEKGAAGTGSKGRAFNFTWPVPGFPEHDVEPTKMQEISQCCRRALHCLAVSRNWSYLLEYCIAFEKARTSLELELSVSLSKIIGPAKAFHEMWLRCKSKASYVHIAYSKADPSRLVVHATGRYQQIQVLRQELLTLIYTGRLHSYGSIRSMASAYFMEGSSFLYAIGTDSKAAMLQARPMYVDRYLLRHAHTMKELSTLSMSGAYKKTNDVWKVAFKADFHAKVAEQLSHLSKVKKDEQVIFSVHLGKMLLLDASRTFERSRGALSASDMESAMNSSRNMKISTYGMEAKQDGAAGVAKSPASKPDTKNKANGKGNAADGGSGRTNAGAIATVKNNLASTFASAIPIFEGADCSTVTGSSSEKSRTPHSLYMENIARVTGKLQSVLGDLGYEEFLLADPQGAIQIPGTTLLLPPAGWRVAVELSERQQLHVDLDAQGRIAAVSDRFLSWVNGTLVTPAEVDLGSPPAAESDTEPAGPAATAATKTIKYQFKDHDLRFKIGTVKTIPASNDLHHLACPGGNPPIEIHNADEDEGESGVDSNLSSEYLRAAQAGGGTALPLIHPSPLMKRPDMVSFARHVVQRRAFLLPSSTATAAVEGACRVMAVVAVGDCYEGAALRDVNPFVDISLEVDASGLLSCLGSQVLLDADSDSTKNSAVAGEEESGDQPDASLAVSDPLALGEHLDSICDEILRVSEKIRETW